MRSEVGRRGGKALCLLLTACATLDVAGTPEYPGTVGAVNARIKVIRDAADHGVFRLRGVPPIPHALQNSEIVLSFVHVSDAQIRDNGLVLMSEWASKLTDRVAHGAERVDELDTNDEYPYLDPRRKVESPVFPGDSAPEEHRAAPDLAESCQKRALMSPAGVCARPGRAAR